MQPNLPQIESVAQRFFEWEHWQGAAPIGGGNINDTYRIDFRRNGAVESWLLQRLNHAVFSDPEGVMHNIRAVAAHLAAQPGFPLQIPAPRPGLNGQLLQRDVQSNYWRVFPFYPGTFAPERLPEPEVAFEAARAYGVFLRALRDFPAEQLVETIPGFHDTDRRWAVFLTVLEKNTADRAKFVQREIESIFEAKPVFEQVSRLKSSGVLPLRLTHNDTKAGNVLLDLHTGKAVAVIDWDTIMPGTVLSDFGDMVRTFAPDCPEDDPGQVSIRADSLDALWRGFLAHTGDFLTEAERTHLPLGALWIIGEQALRFLSDYLAGDVYYKIGYPEHNLVRARNQLALFRQARKQWQWQWQ